MPKLKLNKWPGCEVFRMENTPAAQVVLSKMRATLNHGKYRIRARGRHHNRVEFFKETGRIPNDCKDIPPQLGEEIAVYIDKSNTNMITGKKEDQVGAISEDSIVDEVSKNELWNEFGHKVVFAGDFPDNKFAQQDIRVSPYRPIGIDFGKGKIFLFKGVTHDKN